MCLKIPVTIVLNTILCSIIFKMIPRTHAGPFNYIAYFEELIETQKYVVEYIDSLIDGISVMYRGPLRSYTNRYRKEQSIAMKNVSLYVANPINCFTLVKGLQQDLEYTENLLKQYITYNKRTNLIYPSKEDFTMVCDHIMQIVKVYDLNVTALASGNLAMNIRKDKNSFSMATTPMTSSDCFALATHGYDKKENEIALAWMMEALNKYHDDCSTFHHCSFTEWDIHLFISVVYANLGLIETSENWLKNSRHDVGLNLQQLLCQMASIKSLAMKRAQGKSKEIAGNTDTSISRSKDLVEPVSRRNEFCLQEYIDHQRLYCEFRYGPHPFLRLARFKVEVLHLNPEVTMFYDVISDDAIASIKSSAKDTFPDKQDVTCIPFQNVVIFILEEPNLGGITAFPHLNLSIFPVKNAALYFSSVVHPSKTLNKKMQHQACPVLHGSKWIIAQSYVDPDLITELGLKLNALGKPLMSGLDLHQFNYTLGTRYLLDFPPTERNHSS